MNNTINIKDFLNTSMAVSTDRAELIFKECQSIIKKEESLVLNFEDTKLVITAFLNIAIGKLYGLGLDNDFLDKNITYVNTTPSIDKMIKDVIENSKKFYKDKLNGINSNNYLNKSIDGDL